MLNHNFEIMYIKLVIFHVTLAPVTCYIKQGFKLNFNVKNENEAETKRVNTPDYGAALRAAPAGFPDLISGIILIFDIGFEFET